MTTRPTIMRRLPFSMMAFALLLSACARRGPAEPAPSGTVDDLVRAFAAALDAYPKPDTSRLVLTTTVEHRDVVTATRRLAQLRSARFIDAPRLCGCVDPHVGATRAPEDVSADECGWVAELRANETQVNINVARDSLADQKIIGLHWQAFNAGSTSGAVCSYARQWLVVVQPAQPGAAEWRVVSQQCWLSAGMVTAQPTVGEATARNVNPRGSGCGGWYMKRPDG